MADNFTTMVETFSIHHNPIHGLKREIKSLKEGGTNDAELLRALVESNIGSQHNVSQVMSGLSELLTILKGVDGKEDPEISKLEAKLNKVLEQNYQLIQALNELTTHLKRNKQ
jgi:hypothetical protein